MNELNQMDDSDHSSRHREITLGTATLLGIFFGLVLICAVFFGFGYTLGRRSIQTAAEINPTADSASFNTSKPSPGTTSTQTSRRSDSEEDSGPPAASASRSAGSEAASAQTTRSAATRSSVPMESARQDESSKAASSRNSVAPSHSAAPTSSAMSPTPSASAQPSSPLMVQVAAVSHQEDAEVLVKALKKQGHDVTARQDPTDRLIHVQLGPFASRKEADAMRQTLLTEGYNAIVK